MKKSGSILTTTLLILVLATVFFIIRAQRHKQPELSSTKPQPVIAINKKTTVELKSATVPAQITKKQPVAEYLKEFNLPKAVKTKLLTAAKNGSVNDVWGEGQINKNELIVAGFIPARLPQTLLDSKTKNVTAGLSVADNTFADNLNSTLPDKTVVEDEQTRTLNSEALSDMGFSALMEQNYSQAEEAFSTLIRNYADTEPAPIVHLELARLISEEGRAVEAQQLVDKAILQYPSDSEFITIAQTLKNEIKINE